MTKGTGTAYEVQAEGRHTEGQWRGAGPQIRFSFGDRMAVFKHRLHTDGHLPRVRNFGIGHTYIVQKCYFHLDIKFTFLTFDTLMDRNRVIWKKISRKGGL